MMEKVNGNGYEIFSAELARHGAKLTELERILTEIAESARGLRELYSIATEVKLLRENLLSAALSDKRVPTEALDSIGRAYTRVVYVMSAVFGVITLWLTGLKAFAPHVFQNL
jgi:hypothetical protein